MGVVGGGDSDLHYIYSGRGEKMLACWLEGKNKGSRTAQRGCGQPQCVPWNVSYYDEHLAGEAIR